MKRSETTIAAETVAYLTGEGLDIYQEVTYLGWVADIVALQPYKRTAASHIVECKTALSFGVFGQAARWKPYCNFVWVAVPDVGRGESRNAAYDYARYAGIGVLTVPETWEIGRGVSARVEAAFRRHSHKNHRWGNIAAALVERHKDFAPAGNSNGRRWTPFAQTCSELAEQARKRPGVTLREALDIVGKGHYATAVSARVSLAKWLMVDKVRGVEGRKEGRQWRLYPKGNSHER